MKKQVFLFPLLGLLLAGCSFGHEEPPSQGSANPAGDADTIATSSSSCDCDDGDYTTSISTSIAPVVRKPVIYFYPEEEMDLKVTYVEEERLITTYPKYENGWNIHLQEDGTFTIPGSDREYYGLFFDEAPDFEANFSEGFYVTKENAISFLEEKMDYMGFTNRETDEFIMYWLPFLENNEKSLVYFEQTEERNEECPLEFSVEPETLIRTIIHIKKVDGPTSIKEQQLIHQERTGFTVTEWGGAEH